MTLRVDGARLREDLSTLAQIGGTAEGGFSRTSYGAADAAAREWYRERCTQAGLALRTDGLGNMFAAMPAVMNDASQPPAVWTGSHLDTVPNGGAFDGALGAVGALECVRRLAELDIPLHHPVRAVVFSDEEGNYGHLLGSRGISHGYDSAQLAAMVGRDGDRLVDALAQCEWCSGSPTNTKVDSDLVHAFVELHIEQGPNLEAAGTQIGVVTSIVGLGGSVVEFTGRADHAGTTPMDRRQDALQAAAHFLTRLPAIARGISSSAVATCGLLRVEPGGANIIPGRVALRLDFRDPELDRLEALSAELRAAAETSAAQHGVRTEWHVDEIMPPAKLSAFVQAAVRTAADTLGLSHTPLPSGAGHDSQNMAHVAPTGMIFVPSKDGRSHSPAEHTDWEDIENGANVLLNTLVTLAQP